MKSETLEHALAEAVAKRLTDGHAWAPRAASSLTKPHIGIATAAQLLAELAAAADNESLRHAERQVGRGRAT